MMSTQLGVQLPNMMSLNYPTEFVHDLARQMPPTDPMRRLSRGSSGQRTPNAMRVVKPSSANNSPRSSTGLARRRTLMNDSNLARRRQQVLEYMAMPAPTVDIVDPARRSARPVSWHPSSHLSQHYQPQHTHQNSLGQYTFPGYGAYPETHDSYNQFPTFSPMAPTYSCQTSPNSFSPLALPMAGFDTSHYLPLQNWNVPQQQSPRTSASAPSSDGSQFAEPFPSLSSHGSDDTASSAMLDWNTFVMHGFSSTTPPTPEAPVQTQQQQQPKAEVPAADDEDDGEILIGMGLYDEKYDEDPQLEHSRSSMSQLLGATYPEPMGKGLKLEETWQPPESDDEEDNDDEEEDDE